MLVAGVASVKHRLFIDGIAPVAYPSVGVSPVAPSIEAQFLLHVTVAVGDGSPAAKVVVCESFVQVMRVVGSLFFF